MKRGKLLLLLFVCLLFVEVDLEESLTDTQKTKTTTKQQKGKHLGRRFEWGEGDDCLCVGQCALVQSVAISISVLMVGADCGQKEKEDNDDQRWRERREGISREYS